VISRTPRLRRPRRAEAATRGEKPATAPVKPSMKLLKFTRITSAGAALALLDIETQSGLVLRDFKVMRDPGGNLWLSPPAVRATDRDGNTVIGEKGKPVYRNFIDFRDRATRDRFTAAVLDAVRLERAEIIGKGDGEFAVSQRRNLVRRNGAARPARSTPCRSPLSPSDADFPLHEYRVDDLWAEDRQ
jgi:hypothetical protein